MIDDTLAADLRRQLQAQATATPLRPALDAVHRRVLRRRVVRRRAAVAAVVAAALVTAIALVPTARRSTVSAVDRAELPGILLAPTKPTIGGQTGRTLDRVDAPSAAWSVVLRAGDGGLALRSAVVTFPVEAAVAGEPVRVGEVDGLLTTRSLTWPIAGGHARVRSDLPRDVLLAVARATTVVDGHPRVAGVAGLRSVYRGVFEFGTQRESRYGAEEFGEEGSLGRGLVFGGTLRGAALEDRLLTLGDGRPPLEVNGHRALRWTTASGGVAWEVRPGIQAFVAWSGAEPDDDAWAAIVRIAEGATLVGDDAWAATDPGDSSGGGVSTID